MRKVNLIFGLLSATVGLGILIQTVFQQGGISSIGVILGMLFMLNGAVRIWVGVR